VISVAEARAILRKACGPLPVEDVSLSKAVGRVLARELRSDVDWPPFDASAMDGYALRVEDAVRAGAALAERPGVVGAGDSPGPPLAPGEAVRVMTGAPVPEGTGAVVPVEDVRRDRGTIVPGSPPRPGDHIRRRGESVAAGAALLPGGRRLGPIDIALAALAGADPIAVHRRPRVTVAVTGNELVPVASKPGPAHLRDSNGPMLVALCSSRGLEAVSLPPVPDDPKAVDRLFSEAGGNEDVLITTGGVSAGDFDLLPPAAVRSGFQILFHRVAVRPGKPVAVGRRGETFWLGLPGNPVSASVCFHLFARLALDCLEGADPPGPAFVPARLTRDVAARGHRETYRDARLEVVDGQNRVTPLQTRGSHDLGSHARSNALLRIPTDAERLAAGSLVECLAFGPLS
jgi:molybdopterin molybdotransferase